MVNLLICQSCNLRHKGKIDKVKITEYIILDDFLLDEVMSTASAQGYLRELIRCKDCRWYDERISLCDNCGLPREQTFFCADGKRRVENKDDNTQWKEVRMK